MPARPRPADAAPVRRMRRWPALAFAAAAAVLPLSGGLFSADAATASAPAPAQTSAAARLVQLQAQCDSLGYAPLVGQGPMCEVQNHWFTKLNNGNHVEVAPPDSAGLAQAAG